LEICPQCVARLEEEAGGDAGWQSAREFLVHQMPNSHQSFANDLSSNRATFDGDSTATCTSSAILSILAPTDDPEFVGRIGAYEVSGIVGRGSAGIVVRGFDRALRRNVAIKVLDPSMADVGAARQRFAREARAMAAISHEHVVSVYEVNEHAGVPYFVMEYIPGGSLERRLRSNGPFDVISIVRIGLQTAQALAAAHANGLVHRDIKPGNILLDQGTERVRVADFGLVRVANDVSCTRSGFIAGTPQYMAPEQVKAEICDGRSDLFSLGSVLYALCTGHSPFRADTVYGVLQRIVHDQPRSIRDSNPQIPEWLEDFVGQLMAKNREDRFDSANDVVEILQSELARLQNPAVPQSKPRWKPRKPNTFKRSWYSTLTTREGITSVASVALLIAAVGVALSRLPVGGPIRQDSEQSQTDTTVPPSARTSRVPLWNSDEKTLSDSQAAAMLIESELRSPPNRSADDWWNAAADEISRELDAISAELNAETAKPPK
jgi:serine/threonine-protein kinase